MIVEIALASRTAPRDWWDEDEATIATAVAVLSRMYATALDGERRDPAHQDPGRQQGREEGARRDRELGRQGLEPASARRPCPRPPRSASSRSAPSKAGQAASATSSSRAARSSRSSRTTPTRSRPTVERRAEANGLATSEYQQMAAVVGAQLKAMGKDSGDLAGETDALIDKASDLAATFGGSTADAVAAVGSLLRGERDPIEKYGIAIKEVDVDARLAADGIVTEKKALADQARANKAVEVAEAALAAAKKTGEKCEDRLGSRVARRGARERRARGRGQGADARPDEARQRERDARAAHRAVGRRDRRLRSRGRHRGRRAGSIEREDRGRDGRDGDRAAPGHGRRGRHLQPASRRSSARTLDAFQIIIGVIAAVAAGILVVNAAMTVFRAVTVAATAVQWLLNAALLANPIGIVVLAVAALVAGLILLWTSPRRSARSSSAVFERVRAVISRRSTFLVGLFGDAGRHPRGTVHRAARRRPLGLRPRPLGRRARAARRHRPVQEPDGGPRADPRRRCSSYSPGRLRRRSRSSRASSGRSRRSSGRSSATSPASSSRSPTRSTRSPGAIDSVNPFTATPPPARQPDGAPVAGPWSRGAARSSSSAADHRSTSRRPATRSRPRTRSSARSAARSGSTPGASCRPSARPARRGWRRRSPARRPHDDHRSPSGRPSSRSAHRSWRGLGRHRALRAAAERRPLGPLDVGRRYVGVAGLAADRLRGRRSALPLRRLGRSRRPVGARLGAVRPRDLRPRPDARPREHRLALLHLGRSWHADPRPEDRRRRARRVDGLHRRGEL